MNKPIVVILLCCKAEDFIVTVSKVINCFVYFFKGFSLTNNNALDTKILGIKLKCNMCQLLLQET